MTVSLNHLGDLARKRVAVALIILCREWCLPVGQAVFRM